MMPSARAPAPGTDPFRWCRPARLELAGGGTRAGDQRAAGRGAGGFRSRRARSDAGASAMRLRSEGARCLLGGALPSGVALPCACPARRRGAARADALSRAGAGAALAGRVAYRAGVMLRLWWERAKRRARGAGASRARTVAYSGGASNAGRWGARTGGADSRAGAVDTALGVRLWRVRGRRADSVSRERGNGAGPRWEGARQ